MRQEVLRWGCGRQRTLEACPRQYYFRYLPVQGPEAAEAKRFRYAQSMTLWFDSVFHHVAATLVEVHFTGGEWTPEVIEGFVRKRLSSEWRESASGKRGRNPLEWHVLHGGSPFPPEEARELCTRLVAGALNLQDYLQENWPDPQAVTEWFIPNPESFPVVRHTDLTGQQWELSVRPDLIVLADGRAVVVDWRTARSPREEAHETQQALLSAWARQWLGDQQSEFTVEARVVYPCAGMESFAAECSPEREHALFAPLLGMAMSVRFRGVDRESYPATPRSAWDCEGCPFRHFCTDRQRPKPKAARPETAELFPGVEDSAPAPAPVPVPVPAPAPAVAPVGKSLPRFSRKGLTGVRKDSKLLV